MTDVDLGALRVLSSKSDGGPSIWLTAATQRGGPEPLACAFCVACRSVSLVQVGFAESVLHPTPCPALRTATDTTGEKRTADLVPKAEARCRDQEHSRSVLASAVGMVWPQDLPVCFPGRQCVDFVPAGADLVYAMTALTPLSAGISAGCFAVLGTAFVLIGLGVRLQWVGPGVRPWLVVTVTALLLVGFAITTIVDVWFGSVSVVYSSVYGQPSAPAPSSLAGSWRSVLAAGHAMEILAVVAIAVLVAVAASRRRRAIEA